MKNHRGSFPILRPKAAPRLKAKVSGTSPPNSSEDWPDRASKAHCLVMMSRTRTTGKIVPRKKVFVLKTNLGLRVERGPIRPLFSF